LVNNAGVGVSGDFSARPYEDAARQIQLNITALVRLTHAALGRMLGEGRGTVINVSSVAGDQPGPGNAVYAATKAFVTNFTEGLAEELRGSGVTVTAVCPGLTRTEFHDRGGMRPRVRRVPELAWLRADTVAREALDAAAKGKVVHVNGAAYKVLSALTGAAPRTLRRRAVGVVMARNRSDR
ncbi:MAG TPA: SDR family NAD(P)-dependent oxidoreductase, partial [Acidimicrobiales bacterium]